MENITLRQNKILIFLELKNNQNQAPDMTEIMDFISRQVKCEPIDVIRDIRTLQRKLKIIKVCQGLTTTYKVVHNL
jgi:hypothetical protein